MVEDPFSAQIRNLFKDYKSLPQVESRFYWFRSPTSNFYVLMDSVYAKPVCHVSMYYATEASTGTFNRQIEKAIKGYLKEEEDWFNFHRPPFFNKR